MKGQQLQAQFIRKREIEQQKIQETESKWELVELAPAFFNNFINFQI